MMNNIPIIRLEIEHMKHAMLHAFADYQIHIDETLRNAVEAFCQPDNIERIVTKQVSDSLEQAIRDEVDNFFRWGKGRAAIKAAVLARLEQVSP
jgi:hypothetical protein